MIETTLSDQQCQALFNLRSQLVEKGQNPAVQKGIESRCNVPSRYILSPSIRVSRSPMNAQNFLRRRLMTALNRALRDLRNRKKVFRRGSVD
jgi:hypothetical protein